MHKVLQILTLIFIPYLSFGESDFELYTGLSPTFMLNTYSKKVNNSHFNYKSEMGYFFGGKFSIYKGNMKQINIGIRYQRWKTAIELEPSTLNITALQATEMRFEKKYHGFFIPMTLNHIFKLTSKNAIEKIGLRGGISLDIFQSPGVSIEKSGAPKFSGFQNGIPNNNDQFQIDAIFDGPNSDLQLSPGIELGIQFDIEKILDAPSSLELFYHYTLLPTNSNKVTVKEMDKSSRPIREYSHSSVTKTNPNFLSVALTYSLFSSPKYPQNRPLSEKEENTNKIDKRQNIITLSVSPSISHIIQHNNNISLQAKNHQIMPSRGYNVEIGYQRKVSNYLNVSTGVGLLNTKHSRSREVDNTNKALLLLTHSNVAQRYYQDSSIAHLLPAKTTKTIQSSYISASFGFNLKLIDQKDFGLKFTNQLSLNLLHLLNKERTTRFDDGSSEHSSFKKAFPKDQRQRNISNKVVQVGYKGSLLYSVHLNKQLSLHLGPEFQIVPIFQKLNPNTQVISRENQKYNIGLRLSCSYNF